VIIFRKILPFAIMLLLLFSCACITDDNTQNEGIGIIVSIPPFYEWVSAVGGDNVDITIMVPEGQSPHTYEPTPSQMVKVSKAQIWVKNGVGLEFWTDKIVEGNESINIIDISSGVDLIPLGDGYDPHIWLSLGIAKNAVEQIYDALVKIDPENQEIYKNNMDSYLQRLDDVDELIVGTLGTESGKRFIVYHPAWSYFSRDYGLVQIPIQEGGNEPGPEGITNIIDIARDYGIKVLFIEPQFSTNDAKVIANEIGGEVVAINPLSSEYIDNCEKVARALVEGLA